MYVNTCLVHEHTCIQNFTNSDYFRAYTGEAVTGGACPGDYGKMR